MSRPDVPGVDVEDHRDDLPIFIHSELDDYGLDPHEFRVYARLARRAYRGASTEGIRNMAERIGVSERKVRYTLKVLAEAGLITLHIRPGHTPTCQLRPVRDWSPKEQLPAIRERVGRHRYPAGGPDPEAGAVPGTAVENPGGAVPRTGGSGTSDAPSPVPATHEGSPDKVLQEGGGPAAPTDDPPATSKDHHHSQEREKILKRHLGKLLPTLLEEDARRRAWFELSPETIRASVATAGRLRGNFGTRLKELLDSAAKIEPQKLETPGGPTDVDASRAHRARQEAAARAYEEAYHRALDAGVEPELAEAAAQEAQRAALDPARAQEAQTHDRRNELYRQAERLGGN